METKKISRIDERIDRYFSEKKNTVIHLGDLKLHEEKILCIWHEKEIHLTKKEFDILRILIKRPKIVYSRCQILDILHENNLDVNDRSIDSHIKRLRIKFKYASPNNIFKHIKTFYGFGYSWNYN